MLPLKDAGSGKGFVPATAILILANILVFAWNIRLEGGLASACAVSPWDIMQYLVEGKGSILSILARVMGAAFIHAGFAHLLINCVFMSAFGPAVEKASGSVRFMLAYLAAIVCAFFVHAAVNAASTAPVVGASGAIASLMGIYLVVYPRGKIVTLLPLIPSLELVEIPSFVFILAWFGLQALFAVLGAGHGSHVAWFSHIGGFLFGVIVGVHLRLSGSAGRVTRR